jgi:hypothetical protein
MGEPGCNGRGDEDQRSDKNSTTTAKITVQRIREPATAESMGCQKVHNAELQE